MKEIINTLNNSNKFKNLEFKHFINKIKDKYQYIIIVKDA